MEIGNKIKSEQDTFFDDVDLPSDTTEVLSDVETGVNAGTNSLDIVVKHGAIADGANKTLKVVLYSNDNQGVDNADPEIEIASLDADGQNVEAGEIVFAIPEGVGLYGKVALRAGADISEAKATIFVHPRNR